jgi:hypothetical protein
MMQCSTLRGVSQFCPLIKKVWSSQTVSDIISSIAGLPLKPIMDYELGVCNVQVVPTNLFAISPEIWFLVNCTRTKSKATW